MKTYRWSVRLKLGLIVFAVGIALASLLYTQSLVDRLQEREQTVIQLWAGATAEAVEAGRQPARSYRTDLRQLEAHLRSSEASSLGGLPPEQVNRFLEAVDWAQTMPPAGELDFILNEILEPNPFGIPAIITDSLRQRPLFWRNVGVPDTSLRALSPDDSVEAIERLDERLAEMDASFEPIPIRVDLPAEEDGPQLTQYVYYDESALITELRVYPWVQLLFVGLFVVVGYFGFSYVRQSERSNLWMGMAREAAHQLGTPLSSLMGWVQILRSSETGPEQREQALEEIEHDVERLQRVADRFSDIGSQPKLTEQDLVPIIEQTASYIRRRIPQHGQAISLSVSLPEPLKVPVNEELFAWVMENLLKNALDAIDDDEGKIEVTGGTDGESVSVDVSDTGCGVERTDRKNIFRPGYSTKKRGWGLGLSLAKRVVEVYHGGTLKLLDSTVGDGSTFRIVLPK